MSRRRMDARAAAVDAGRWLRDRLGRADRILALGWNEPPPEVAAVTEGRSAASPAVARPETFPPGREGEGPFPFIIWRVRSGAVPVADLRQVRNWLRRDGRLLVLADTSGDRDASERKWVRSLAESGFVVLRQDGVQIEGTTVLGLMARRDPYLVRSYRDGDDEAIAALFESSFRVERRPEHWHWKYHGGPWGGRLVSLALTQEGELASHYSGYPVPFWIDDGSPTGRNFLGLQMGDTMTHPDHRSAGRGTASLLARTVRHFFAIHRRGALGFYYGFNTGAIRRFCDWFIGGSEAESVRYRVRTTDASFPDPGEYRVERLDDVTRELDTLFQRAAPAYGFLVRRDAEYLRWRYVDCPDGGFVVLAARHGDLLVGWSVFRRRDDTVVWGDALFEPRHVGAAGAILAAALRQAELADGAAVEGWFPDRPAFWDHELARLGFEVRPEKNGLTLVFLPDTEPDIGRQLQRLYYTMGDGDLF